MFKLPIHYRFAKKLKLIGNIGTSTTASHIKSNKLTSPLLVFVKWLFDFKKRKRSRIKSDYINDEKIDYALQKVDDYIDSNSHITLPVTGSWVYSGFSFNTIGESITVLANGRLFLSKLLEVSLGPHTCIWYRIGNGHIIKLRSKFENIVADQIGRLEFCVAEPGAFDSQKGDIKNNNYYRKTGEIELKLIRWVAPVSLSIKKAADIEPLVFSALYETLDNSNKLKDWHAFWRIGQTNIFNLNLKNGAICCDTKGDIGIIKYAVNMPLEETLQFSWSWCVDQLPSSLSENIRHTHDYLSIAIEFDNGLDLTYMWSATLEKDTIFQCPLPWWDQREIHWVLRNIKEDETDIWFDEKRNVLEDYKIAIDPNPPKEIVSIWLIAGSRWQNSRGTCQYRSIKLKNNNETVVIHP